MLHLFSCIAVLAATACTGPESGVLRESIEADHFVPSRPETVSWGWYPIDKEPVLRIRSGETVRINTLTHAGATQRAEPVEYLTGLGIPREEIHQDVLDFWASRDGRPREGRSGHVITGPVYVEGAGPGDPHGAQGDGEVSGTAIEQSLAGVFRFVVHKGVTISGPRGETDTHYMIMGIDLDLDRATRHATWEVIDFLVKEKGLTPPKALSLASIAGDFRVSEVVDLTQVVTGYIPKDIFLR